MSNRNLLLPEEIRLSNGIPVLLQHYDGPVAATYWWIDTGSADERPAEAGFAHFLEHMLFKDAAAKETGMASEGKTARAIESLGGDINAYTSFDQTVYHVTCAEHHWEKVLDAFGAMAAPQKFLKTDFEREREVILEELRKNEDSPGRMLFQQLFAKTFRKHPYGRPVIGFPRTLKAAKVSDLEAFYRRRYISGRMGVILVGPIGDENSPRRKALIKQLEKRFGGKVIPKRAAGAPEARTTEPSARKTGTPIFSLQPFDVKTPTVSISFRVPGLEHEDIPALDLIGGILGMGELSRLYQRLFYQTSLATEASGGVYVPRDPGMMYFQAEVADVSKIAPATQEMLREILRLREEGPAAEELERVITNVESERLYATQSADGMAGRVGYLRFVLGDMDYDRKYLERLRAVDAAKIREVMHRYIIPERMSGVVQVPKSESSFDLSPLEAAAETALKHTDTGAEKLASSGKRAKKKGAATKAPVELLKLPSGIRVVHFERPQSHVFSLHAAMFGGLRLELSHPVTTAEQDWGSSYMMSLTWTKGTTSLDARQIATLVEGRAANLDGFAGRNTVGVQMTGLARDWNRLSGLYLDVLLNASFPESEVDHSRRVAEDSVRGIEDHSSQLCSKLFLGTLFERHPYGKLTTGSLESLASIDSARLREFHRRWVRPERMVIALSGNIPRSTLDLWMEDLESRASKISTRVEALPIKLEDEPDLKAPRWVEKSLGREQAHILVGGLGTTIRSEDRYALRLMQTILGGQSGRLFIELREKKSLAYTVSPVSFEGMERGYVGTYIACSPQKRDEAIAGIRAVLEKLASRGPTAAEMARAKEFFLGRRAMDMQSDSALAAHYGLETLYDIPLSEDDEVVRRVRALTAKKVQEVCRKYLIEPPMVTAVVG